MIFRCLIDNEVAGADSCLRLPARWHEVAVQLRTWLRSRVERTNYRRGVDLVDLVVLQGCELESNLCTSSLKLIGFRLDERIEKKCRSTAHDSLKLQRLTSAIKKDEVYPQ